ncbi:MAG: AAA family ATPase, partial [Dehalococcoidia bacterium]|nr:AAA family ATPase [Dehalococcoidia bacterium]
MRFEISVKPTFLNQLRAMPNKDVGLMIKKVVILQTDPSPRGSLKKKMEGYKDLYRLRAGDYRVFYNYGDGWVTLLGVGTHDMYGNPPAFWSPNLDTRAVPSGDLSAEPNRLGTRDRKGRWEWIDQESEQTKTDLARPIDNALVERLNVPKEFWPALCVCRTVEDLYSAKVPNSIRDRVFDAASAPNYDLVLQQPDYVTGDPSNLLRFVEGDLPGFLLKLDAYQEKYVEWAISETGPTLVKGGPGTGKSTIALYRVRSFLRVLRASGVPRPRILFTTYTNALTRFSEQLLRHLLGDDSELVEVRTADRVANDLVSRVDGPQKVAYAKDIKPFLTDAISSSAFNGGAKSRPQALTIQGMTGDYLFEEIGSVIEANGLQSLDEYVAIPRSAQSIPLNASQRAAVWRVYESLSQIMRRKGWISLQELHRRALDLLRSGSSLDRYDAVVIDEAQDLDPNLLRTLFALCRSRNRV